MAIAGGATVAYRVQVLDGELRMTQTTTLRSQCESVAAALVRLERGEQVTLAGSDMVALRLELWGEED